MLGHAKSSQFMLNGLASKIRLYNSLTHKKERFVPLRDDEVKIYVCGPTVYDFIHIGNARPMLVFDVLRKFLQIAGYKVTYMQNFTDIDDKIIRRSQEEGCEAADIARKYIAEYKKDASALHVTPPDSEPRATETVPAIITMIEKLIAAGYAYVSNEAVYFKVKSLADYGKLSGHNLDDLMEGQRELVHSTVEDKADNLDFALWKFAKAGEPAWESPWGAGRPGWHIECSAMIHKHLGDEIDIHCGGRDLIFPHHENEIAQSQAYTGKLLARYWLHNAYINVDNVKMSKSLGNFWRVRDLAGKFDYRVIRYFMLSSHYRSQLNFSVEAIESAQKALARIDSNCERYLFIIGKNDKNITIPTAEQVQAQIAEFDYDNVDDNYDFSDKNLTYTDTVMRAALAESKLKFISALADDLNTASAISELFNLTYYTNLYLERNEESDVSLLAEVVATLRYYMSVLGISDESAEIVYPPQVLELVEARQLARSRKDYKQADTIREQLTALGYGVKDTADGPQIIKL